MNYIEGGSEPAMVAGASPGVDGNFMEPKCFYRSVTSSSVSHRQCVVELHGTDALDLDSDPLEASLVLEETLEIDSNGEHCVAVLGGIDFSWACDHAKQPDGQPGNSDAVWPVEFDVSVVPELSSGPKRSWRVRVRVVRGWTPMRGGIPLIEEKPLNFAMDLCARVHLTILDGTHLQLQSLPQPPFQSEGAIRNYQPTRSPVTELADASFCVSALTQFGFSMPRRKESGPLRHRGRYLSAIGFGLEDTSAGFMGWARIWAPVTVFSSPVNYTLTPVILKFGDETQLEAQRSVAGSVHSNSSPQAPFFSKWNKFESNQTRTRVLLAQGESVQESSKSDLE